MLAASYSLSITIYHWIVDDIHLNDLFSDVLDDKGMRGALSVFARRAAVTFETRRWIESSRRDKFVFPPKATKKSETTKMKELSRGPESSIDAMLLMKAQSRAETPR
jgi:hypothetical protein